MRHAETKSEAAEGAVIARLPEASQWLLEPVQTTPQSALQWRAQRLSGREPLEARASKQLRADEHLILALAGTRLLRM